MMGLYICISPHHQDCGLILNTKSVKSTLYDRESKKVDQCNDLQIKWF